jgi:plastocyanin
MTNIDKAAIVFSIVIVAIGAGFAFYAGNVQDNAPAVSAPVIMKTEKPEIQKDPFADIADKVKAEEKPVACTLDYVPVCGVDGVIYGNQCQLDAAKIDLDYLGECLVEEESSEPKTVSVTIPTGTASPGCETSNACYSPASVTINLGDTVEWKNVDTAAHTVTGGSPSDGPSGVFDSSLIMAGASFENTFDAAGSYDYFCMVHPWMVGNVQVN